MVSKLPPASWAGIAVVLAEPVLSLIAVRIAGIASFEARLIAQASAAWVSALGLVLLVLLGERRSLASIGIVAPKASDLLWAAGGFVAATLLVLITMPIATTLELGTVERGVRGLAPVSPWLRALLSVTAGVTEEILFRGFLVERLGQQLGRFGAASVLSWALFTALHLPFWGTGGALQIGAISLVFYFVYWMRRSLAPCVMLHVANDLYAFLIVPLLMPEFS